MNFLAPLILLQGYKGYSTLQGLHFSKIRRISTTNYQRCHKRCFYLMPLATVFTPFTKDYGFMAFHPLPLFA